jgi:hypothetical protein
MGGSRGRRPWREAMSGAAAAPEIVNVSTKKRSVG